MNGTAALHIALKLAGVLSGDLVVTQSLTFVATCNAIAYCSAEPLFVDVDRHTLGLSPAALDAWLTEHALIDDHGDCRTCVGQRRIRACLPMHTFGHPVELDALIAVCERWHLILIEDAAESLGSYYKGRHTGNFGKIGVLSFNGNKIMTTGGGGMLLTDEDIGKRAKHLTTTAKIPHPYEFVHDEVGYNYRLPNLNAALGCAQLEQLPAFLASKRTLAARYIEFFKDSDLQPIVEPVGCRSNYWLNGVICQDGAQRDALLKATNDAGVMTRPIWALMTRLPIYANALRGPLDNAEWLEARVVNLPSSVLPEATTQ
jgi:aminotransferase in exopolysaccharide biosynthesis